MSAKVQDPNGNFLNVNGVNLHYLDWGGTGEAILFLGGLGVNAHAFYSLATHFTDQFRVLALSRRCHGLSDIVDYGFDLQTRVGDIAVFLEHLAVEKTALIGHSMAGPEITYFAASYPKITTKLIYLDAVRDNTLRSEVLSKDPLNYFIGIDPPVQKWDSVDAYFRYCRDEYPNKDRWDVWEKSLLTNVEILEDGTVIEKFKIDLIEKMRKCHIESIPDYNKITVPVLCFVALEFEYPQIPDDISDDLREEANSYLINTLNAWKLESVKQLVEDANDVHVIKLENVHHYFFIDHEEETARAMREFLLS